MACPQGLSVISFALEIAQTEAVAVMQTGIATLVALGHALRPPKRDLGPMLALGRALIADQQRPLRHFHAHIAARPDWLRSYWMGQSALARAKLPPLQRRAIDLLGIEPDLLGPTGDRFDEVMHTKSIAWALQHPTLARQTRLAFLDVLEAHGVPHKGATAFERGDLAVDSLRAGSEVALDRAGRVDVWLEGPTDVFVVEGKLLAGEGADQTGRYERARHSRANGRRWTVVFLTLDADQEPTGPAVHITFRQLLAAWLPVAAHGDTQAHRHLAAYLASVGRICGVVGPGTFDDWNFIERRSAVELVLGRSTE